MTANFVKFVAVPEKVAANDVTLKRAYLDPSIEPRQSVDSAVVLAVARKHAGQGPSLSKQPKSAEQAEQEKRSALWKQRTTHLAK